MEKIEVKSIKMELLDYQHFQLIIWFALQAEKKWKLRQTSWRKFPQDKKGHPEKFKQILILEGAYLRVLHLENSLLLNFDYILHWLHR